MELDFRKAILLRLVLVAITSLHSHFANNLPTPGDVISMYKQEKITLLRLFEPKPEVLEALRGSGLKVSLGMKNEDVSNIASDVNKAKEWVKANVAPYAKDVNFGWISVTVVVAETGWPTAGATIGVNYGIEMANIPSPLDVVKLCQKEKITQVRLLFNGSQELIDNLTSSGISVSFTMGNDEVEAMAETWYTAMQWFRTNVEPLFQVGRVNFDYIAIGNNMVSGPGSDRIVTAMSNMWEVLNQNGLAGKIKVTTIVNASVLGVSNPPSAGELNSEAKGTMIKIIDWLRSTNNPLMIDVHPYLALASDPSKVPLEYALFNTTEPVIIDGQYKYYSLFEATVDAFYAALEKNGWSSNATLVVSGTGWPSAGNAPYTSIQNAQTYNQKLIDKMKQSGTPRRPKDILDISISSLFNEDQKAAGVEQNWGINYPDSKPVYPLNF